MASARRPILAAVLVLGAASAQVKTKVYGEPQACIRTYRMAAGRILTSRGLVEDPTVNKMVNDAVSVQMNALKIGPAGKDADLEIRFMGGNSAGLQSDDLTAGDMAVWDIGGPLASPGRTYKKSDLVIAAVDSRSNRTIWAARCTDKFGDPAHLEERIQKALAKAFAKFPKKLACSS